MPDEFQPDLYKKWYRSRGGGGFLTIRPWFEAGKIYVEIGAIAGSELEQATGAYVDANELGAYLRAVSRDNAVVIYGAREELSHFGGGKKDGKPISRVLQIRNKTIEEEHPDFEWRVAHFDAKEGPTGAFIPVDMKNPLQYNSIKQTRQQMNEISYLVDTAIQAHTAQHTDWLKHWTSKKESS